MKHTIILLLVLLGASSCADTTETAESMEPTERKTEEMTKQLRHVVLFKFKENTTPTAIEKVEAAFVSLPSKIKEIKDLEWGLNNSPESLNKGFTHCFFVTFDTEEERAAYLPHPSHLAFVDVLSPHLEDVLVIDYWTN